MRQILTAAVVLSAALCASGQDFHTGALPGPSPQASTMAEANAALAARNYAQALKLLLPLAAANPRDATLAYDLGSSQDALDQTGAAEQSYRAAIADDPAMLSARVALGLLLARAGKLAEARAQFAAAVALPQSAEESTSKPSATPDPAGDRALRARADRALARIDQKQRPADARDELLEALRLSPETSEDTLLSAELAETAANDAAPAEAAYRRVLATQPGNPEATAGLASLLSRDKHPEEAEALLRSGLKLHPGDPAMSVQMAALLGNQGKSAEAVPLVESLHAADPNNPEITRTLAHLDLAAGRDAAAESLLARLLAQNPGDTCLADDRARALIHLKRFAEAQNILTPLVAEPKLFPAPDDLADAAADLAFAASENSQPEAALRALAIRATVLPPSAPVLFLEAISHDKLHQVQQARAAYRQFLAAAKGEMPDQEFEATHRLVTLDAMR